MVLPYNLHTQLCNMCKREARVFVFNSCCIACVYVYIYVHVYKYVYLYIVIKYKFCMYIYIYMYTTHM